MKLRHLSLVIPLLLSMACPLTAQNPVQPPGDGSPANPYRISTLDHLAWMSTPTTSTVYRYYQLENDIDASATLSWDEGKGFWPIASFNGSFNGNGFAIRNLFINRAAHLQR